MAYVPITNLRGPAARITAVSAETVPADEPAEVTMTGPDQNRAFHFKFPRGLPGVNAVPADEAVGTYIDAQDTESGKATRRVALSVIHEQSPVALAAWSGALRNRENKAARMVVIGDSVTEGRTASTVPGTRWVDLLAKNLRLQYPVSGIGAGGGVGYLPFHRIAPLTSSPWSVVGAPAPDMSYGLGLRTLTFSAAGMKATATITGTSVDLLFLKGTLSRVAYYKVDAAPAVTFNTGGESAVSNDGVLRIPLGAPGPHTLEIGYSGGSASYLEGVIVYNGDENKGVHVIEAGHSGYHTSEYDSTVGLNHVARVKSLAPDLVVFALGENDYLHGRTSASFKTNLTSLIAKYRAALPNASLMTVMNFEANAAGGNVEPWSAFVSAAAEVAAADTGGPFGRAGVAFLDLSEVMPRVVDNTGSIYADNYHPNDKGMRDYGYYVHRALSPS